jgi:peptide/nickel transport system permease protein
MALLLTLVVLGIIGPWIVPFPGAGAHWHDIGYWQDSPAAAPPVWTNAFRRGDPAAVTAVLLPGAAVETGLDNGARMLSWDFTVAEAKGRALPDMILRIRGAGTLPVIVERIDTAGTAGARELFHALVDLSLGQDARISLPASSRPGESGMVVYRVRTLRLPAQAAPPAPSILVRGQVSGLLGTDAAKRDIFTGLVLGIRWALLLGVLASFLTVLTGMAFGIIAGCLRGVPDAIISRLYEFFYLMPVLPFLIVVSTVYRPSLWSFFLLIILFFWTRIFKPIYAMALQIREELYIEAARSLGARRWRVLSRHVFPTLLPYGLAVMALSVPGIIVYEASVSLLGLGDTSTVTWGQMLHEALTQGAVINRLWWWVLPPGLAIALTGLSFALLGIALERALRPRSRGL